MTTSARLLLTTISVTPGEEARVGLVLRNDGAIVEAYDFAVVGDAAPWTVVEPSTINLNPGQQAEVAVVFRPAGSASVPVPAGPVPFGVRVLPRNEPQYTALPEGLVEVLPVNRVTAELTPRISQARGAVWPRVAIDNQGNRPSSTTLSGADHGNRLVFQFPSAPTVTDPGRASFVRTRVRPRRRIWRGQAVPHVFQVLVAPDSVEPITLEGTYVQQPVISRALLKALAAVVALAVLLTAAWFGLLRPAVRSAAKDAVKDPVQAAQSQAAEAQKQASTAASAAAAAQQAAGGVTPKPAPSPTATPGPSLSPGVGPQPGPAAVLTTKRLSAAPAQGKSAPDTYPVPVGKTFRLTDLILENPQGDSGTITITVDGTTLLAPALENFREQDFHWASAILISAKQSITITVYCTQIGHPVGSAPGTPATCSDAALLSGALD